MLSRFLCRLIGLGGALIMLLPAPAEAQIVRRFRGGGLQVRAPLVRVNVGPYGGVSVRAPLVAVDPGSVRVGLRRRLAPVPQQAAPAARAVPRSGDLSDRGYSLSDRGNAPSDRGPLNRAYVPFPTAEELAAMDDATLFTAVNDLGYSLEVRLSRLETGAGWQQYLRIPESALSAPAASFDRFAQTLARYDSVADNPEFAKIAGLPSFIATKAALRQVVARLAGAQTVGPARVNSSGPEFPSSVPPSAEEILPTPAVPVEPEATRGEHSILKRALRN